MIGEDTNVDLVLEKPQATEHQIHPPEYSENLSEKTMCDGYSTTPKQYEIDIEVSFFSLVLYSCSLVNGYLIIII